MTQFCSTLKLCRYFQLKTAYKVMAKGEKTALKLVDSWLLVYIENLGSRDIAKTFPGKQAAQTDEKNEEKL